MEKIAGPKGSVKLMGIGNKEKSKELSANLLTLSQAFQKKGVFASWTVLKTDEFAQGIGLGIQALEGAFFKPNILFVNLYNSNESRTDLKTIIREAIDSQLGILIFAPHSKAGFGQTQTINVWIRDRSPSWMISWDVGNLDLSILLAYKLKVNWNAQIRLITVIEKEEEFEHAQQFMKSLMDLARLPKTETIVLTGSFLKNIANAPLADLNIFGTLEEPDFDFIDKMVKQTSSSCVFVRDSGFENVMA